jgi:hypothetical protein
MMDIAEVLKNIDIEKFAEDFEKELREKREKKAAFWNSPLCQTMIDDMKAVKLGLDAESFSYFPEEVKSMFGWEHISNDDINLFINVMADSCLGVDEKAEPDVDEDCMFDNYSFVKKGIVVSIMIGQGSSVYLRAE